MSGTGPAVRTSSQGLKFRTPVPENEPLACEGLICVDVASSGTLSGPLWAQHGCRSPHGIAGRSLRTTNWSLVEWARRPGQQE